MTDSESESECTEDSSEDSSESESIEERYNDLCKEFEEIWQEIEGHKQEQCDLTSVYRMSVDEIIEFYMDIKERLDDLKDELREVMEIMKKECPDVDINFGYECLKM